LRPGTVTALLSMWLASAIATVCAWQLHCWRRREFFAREAGQKAEADWQQTFNTVPDCVAILDDQHRVVRVNRAMAERLGARAEQCVGLHCYEAVHGTTGPHESCPHAQTCRDHGEHTVEVHEPRLSGDFLVSTTPRFDAHGRFLGAVPVARDVTERKRAEERIRASLAEKEVLLKEIHHRVKNNMQVISSLVALQAEGSHDPAMRAVLQDVTHRVRSMALVHEKLYQSADMARVEFSEYARSLLSYLWRAHGTAASAVRLTLDLEPVPPPVNAAVPCGLILNELVSNALKHAFCGPAPPGRGGEVTVSLRGGPQGRVCLRVRDNGKGLPAGLDWRQANSLGLRLVQMLAGQLHGTLEVSGGEGADFSLTFLEPKPLENQSS
jgi:PAS domain S-box-containing protein